MYCTCDPWGCQFLNKNFRQSTRGVENKASKASKASKGKGVRGEYVTRARGGRGCTHSAHSRAGASSLEALVGLCTVLCLYSD